MRTRFRNPWILFFGVLCAGTPLLAHHGSSWFDKSKPMTLTGTITKLDWANPHTYLYVDVQDANGKVQNWAVEAHPPANLRRSGWTVGMFAPGTTISISVDPARPGTALAAKLRSSPAADSFKSDRYVAGGCATLSANSPKTSIGYGPRC